MRKIRGLIANCLLWRTWEDPFDFFRRLSDESQTRFHARILFQPGLYYEDGALREVSGEAAGEYTAYSPDQFASPGKYK